MHIRWKEERGSALLLVVFMILLFTMLGIAIMGATLGGAQRSETREKDVQSLHLAEMALNEAASKVLSFLDRNQDMSIEELEGKLDQFKSELDALKEKETRADVGESATGNIYSISVVGKDKSVLNINSKAYTITIKAQAVVDGVKRMLAQDIELDPYPDFLKYAMGSEGNVYLNGAPYIMGNLYAGKKLWVKNEADYRYHLADGVPDLHQQVVFPRVDGLIYVQPTALGNEASIQACEAYETMPCGGNYQGIDPDKSGNAEEIQKYFGVLPDKIMLKDQNKFVTVNVKESFYDKVAEAGGLARSSLNTLGNVAPETVIEQARRLNSIQFTDLTEPPELGKDATPEQIAANTKQKNSLISAFNGTLLMSAIYRGQDDENGKRNPLIIDGKLYSSLLYSTNAKNELKTEGPNRKTNWFIVEGDLIIDATSPDATRSSSPIQVRGNILVTGDLRIKGDVEMDATVIALGKSTIEDATITGLNKKELVLISQGSILINRVDPFNTISNRYPGKSSDQDPAVLDAFFYTDKEADLYGVGSAFWISGGFFAKGDITINAVLGNTSASGDQLSFDRTRNTDEKADRGLSRFVVAYNSAVYVDQQVGLPRVQRINMTVGPKRFAD